MATPTVAIERCKDVTGSMAALSCDVFVKSINMLGRYNEKEAQSILDDEERWTAMRICWAPIWSRYPVEV